MDYIADLFQLPFFGSFLSNVELFLFFTAFFHRFFF